MIFNMQSLLRSFGYIKGYYGEVRLCATYFFFAGFEVYWYIVYPVFIFKINTSEYTCSDGVRDFVSASREWASFVRPIAY